MQHAQGVTSEVNRICNRELFHEKLARSKVCYVHSYLALGLEPRSESKLFSVVLIIES